MPSPEIEHLLAELEHVRRLYAEAEAAVDQWDEEAERLHREREEAKAHSESAARLANRHAQRVAELEYLTTQLERQEYT